MRFRKSISFILMIVIVVLSFASITVTTISASGKETPKRVIAIVYDNSGSMFLKNNKAWCQALYAVEVFAAMMNSGDKLMVYPMNPMGPEDNTSLYTRTNPLIITNDSQKNIIQNLKSDLNEEDDTPIEAIDFANEGLKRENADEKWLVVLTDGEDFYENEKSLGKEKTKPALEERFNNYILDSNILYLGIGVTEKLIPNIKSTNSNFYDAKSAKSENVPSVLTEMCNNIFGRDALKGSFVNLTAKSINFDIPLSKLYVFIQGNEIGNVKIQKDGKELSPIQTFVPAYNSAGCEYRHVPSATPDTSLKGYMAVYSNLEKGTYTYSCSGTVNSTAFYYEVDADLQLCFTKEDGTIITNPDEVAPGEYVLEYALVDNDGNILQSDLLGNIDFSLKYSVNGETKVEKNKKSSGKMTLHIDENTEFALNEVEVNFLSGYKIRKDGDKLGFLSIPFRGIKGAAKTFNLKLSGGAKEVDADLVSDVPAYIATLTYDGKQLTGEELNSVQFNASVSKTEIKCDVNMTDSGFEIKLIPEEGCTVVPAGEYIITGEALISSETVADSSASASVRLKVKEVSDSLSLELVYSSTIYSTMEGKVPEIIANIKYNGEMLNSKQFEKLVFTAKAEGIGLIVKPIPDKSAYLIMPNVESDVEIGEYPIDIVATGVTDRAGDILTANGSVGITVQLLPQWVVVLLWILALLLIAFLIWLWLRTPVLPKIIDLGEGSIRVSIDGEEQRVLTATVDYPKKGKRRTITIEASPGALSNVYISATLVPAKDSYRYLPSSRRKAFVVNDSVDASRNVNSISMGNVRFTRDEKNNLQRKPAGLEDFEFPMSRVNFSGAKSIHGRNTDFSITGNVVFKDRK